MEPQGEHFASARPERHPVREEFRPRPRAVVGAVGSVATLYFIFLSFAEFGFLHAVLASAGADPRPLRVVMGVLAVAGVAASVVAGRWYAEERRRLWLYGSYLACALAAALSLFAGRTWSFTVVAALCGAGLGAGTVSLAAALRRVTGGRILGSCIGAGTGLAYAAANLPVVMNSGPAGQALAALGAAALGLAAARELEPAAPAHRPAGPDYEPRGIAAWVTVLLALVWLDSAAFFILQGDSGRWAASWGSDRSLYANALVHAVAALLAGYALDRRWVGRSTGAAAGLLLTACALQRHGNFAPAGVSLLYLGGVSIYSTVLVFYPARSGRAWLAALVYAVAGWGGSGLGIVMAQNSRQVPDILLAAAGAVVAGAMVMRGLAHRQARRAASA